ncbi:outer membrane beta-barrel protein [Robertkochia solimangrovi]|uniref:outer membrane beta-barrel protein n=1 Tax=Robertkochia solimangrovi TaxID=2213046 RepID=UPI001180D00E|nr:outer membrane beta-barrel protein [Robertkochia solimangrovi]TRZ43111.1 TonB-dependent receptor [Robertkochia solimangrovi]
MKKLYLLLLAVFLSGVSYAQDYMITGRVSDADTKEALEASTVYVESIQDSVMVSYTITGKEGIFELEFRTRLKSINLFVTYNGYESVKKTITLDQQKFDMGDIPLSIQAEQLEGVDVVAERVPIVIKKDTLEFNANSFKTRPDANVEDVLKKLPGVEVDLDGNIKVNGKEVNRVLVNGQVFFDSDPKVATKNLPKDIIEKIQITDTKTKEQEFKGQQGDGETKTINLTIRKDKNKGMFGRFMAGYGTDDRYQANGLLNYFKDTKRISILGSSNNINSPGFSMDEVFGAVGGGRGRGGVNIVRGGSGFSINGISFGGGQGITTSSSLGGDFAVSEKDKYEISTNYFYSNGDSFNEQRTSRENILPDGSYFTDSEGRSEGLSNSHRGGANLEFDIDKTLRINVNPNMSVSNTNTTSTNSTISRDADGSLINSNETSTISDGEVRNFSNQVEIFKRLDTIGKVIRVSFANDNSESLNTSNLLTERNIYGDNATSESLDQLTEVKNNSDSYTFGISYEHPITSKLNIEAQYEYDYSEQKNERSVYDFNVATGDYDSFNQTLSSDFDFRNIRQSPSLGLNYRSEKVWFSLSGIYQMNDIRNEDFLQQTSFSKDYENMLFRLRGRFQFGKNFNLFTRYNASVDVPSISQLQPVPDVSNPLNIVVGNPDLNPTVNHNLSMNINNFDWRKGTGLFMYVNYSYQQDQVVAVTTTDEDFLRTTEYTNIDGSYSYNVGVGYSKQIKQDSTLNMSVRLDPNLTYSKSLSYNNASLLEAKTFAPGVRLSTTLNFREMVEVEPQYNISFNETKYNLEAFDNVSFISHTAGLKTTTYWPKNIIWGNDINYTYNGNVGEGFDKDALFWNMSLGAELFKQKVSLKVIAYDLLDQNINTTRSTGVDYIQDTQGTVLQQYFMVTLTYKFDQFGGKGAPQGGMRRGFRMRRF